MDENNDVQLIIKAPNQNIDDQVIHCSLDWSIIELKHHLSDVYPSKPDTEEQKLIYSGRLLHNHLMLKDVLRREDKSSSVHTLHLVCSRQSRSYENNSSHSMRRTASSSSSEDGHSSDSLDDFTDRWSTSHRSQLQSDASDDYSGSSGETSIRSTSPSGSATPSQGMNTDENEQLPYMPQVYANYGIPHPSQTNPAAGAVTPPQGWLYPQAPQYTPYDMATQMAVYQQLYASYYAQCMQNLHSVANSIPVVASTQQNPVPVLENRNDGEAPPQVAPPAAPPPPHQQPAPNRNLRMNAQGGPLLDDNENGGNRDWLDYFYVWCRGFVLFSIVYFYSSPERLLLVVGLGLLAFLYQEGWILARMRNDRGVENRPNRPQTVNEAQNNTGDAPPQNQNGNLNERERPPENEIEAIMDGDDPPHVQNPDVTNNQNPAWTFITSFFSSLIPEPPAPVNIN